MPSKDLVLGLSITDKCVQAVELEHDGQSNTLLALDEWENPLLPNVENDEESKQKFIEYLSAFIKVNRIKSRRAAVAMDSSQLFINSFPLEDGVSQVDINEHVNWELRQYFPSTPPKEFVTDIHVMNRNAPEHWNHALSVSVKRKDAFAVENLIAGLKLDLAIIDVDHFAADTALRYNYPDAERKFIALVGVKEDRLDVSLLKTGVMESYTYYVVQSNQEIVDHITALSQNVQGIQSITVYGPYLDKDLLVLIRRSSALLVEALNPLRHVKIADSLRLADHLSTPSYRFASAVGVALRRD